MSRGEPRRRSNFGGGVLTSAHDVRTKLERGESLFDGDRGGRLSREDPTKRAEAIGPRAPLCWVPRWAATPLCALGIALGAGSLSALFLFLLERVTSLREAHPASLYALPVIGWALGTLGERVAGSAARGHTLIFEALDETRDEPQHDERQGDEAQGDGAQGDGAQGDGAQGDGAHEAPHTMLPFRMAPWVLFGTLLSHAGGASAGREGTAVQMGAALAEKFASFWPEDRALRRTLLLAGIAGGFGSVFGTPAAGAVFALEVASARGLPSFRWTTGTGLSRARTLMAALIASFGGHAVASALGTEHTAFKQASEAPLTFELALRWGVFALIAGAVASLYLAGVSGIKRATSKLRWPYRAALGGAVVVFATLALGTREYLGLGVPSIVSATAGLTPHPSTFLVKLAFTAVTVGTGFVGGEVTPLFFVGATLGAVFANLVGIPISLGASVGLAAVFAAVARAPLALTVMAAELFGPHILVHAAIVCVGATLVRGPHSLYRHATGRQSR